jgi:hypothetical protein
MAISAFTALFILGMIWLRTRMHYARRAGARLGLQRAGRIYFAVAVAVLALGWFAAPALGSAFWPATRPVPVIPRVVWFLATYYVFIIVHRVLKANGVEVFKVEEPSQAEAPR